MEHINSILITGAAGFIGSSIAARLLREVSAAQIVGLDNLNHYYDVGLKKYRLKQIEEAARERPEVSWSFAEGDISDRTAVERVFAEHKPDVVVHLAAQAGVRYSIENPDAYVQSNIIGFYNMLEACRHCMDKEGRVQHFVYASSSSVYGNNKKIPYSTADATDRPVSLYAATKKADEVMAYSYAKLYGIPSLQHPKALVPNRQLYNVQAAVSWPLKEADPTGLVLFHTLSGAKNFTVSVLIYRNYHQNRYSLILSAPVAPQIDTVHIHVWIAGPIAPILNVDILSCTIFSDMVCCLLSE